MGTSDRTLFCKTNQGVIQGCSVSGNVENLTEGENPALFCASNNGTIQNCYAKGSLSVYNNAGFVCQNLKDGTVRNCYCVASLDASETGSYTKRIYGPIVAQNKPIADQNKGVMEHCYYDANLCPHVGVDDSIEMKTELMQSSVFTDILNQNNPVSGMRWTYHVGEYPCLEQCYTGTVHLEGYEKSDCIYLIHSLYHFPK